MNITLKHIISNVMFIYPLLTMTTPSKHSKNNDDQNDSEKDVISSNTDNNKDGPNGDDSKKDVISKKIDNNSDGVEQEIKGRVITFEDSETKKEEVFLRVYDISGGAAKIMSESLLGCKIDGIWHTSLELYGNEYYFQNGLAFDPAGCSGYGQCVKRISLGTTDCKKEALEEFLEMSKQTWTPEAYHLLDNNCNNFTDFLANFLLEKGIPKYILELPEKVKASPGFERFFRRM